jgi:hypothetical protein
VLALSVPPWLARETDAESVTVGEWLDLLALAVEQGKAPVDILESMVATAYLVATRGENVAPSTEDVARVMNSGELWEALSPILDRDNGAETGMLDDLFYGASAVRIPVLR